ncbi:uncharacterized protein LOC144660070 [Oculina patagonica]
MVRVDHGTEHSLMLFVQEYLKDQRGNLSCEPYVQTRSRENLPAERKWPEINQRVTYPIKETLVRMENNLMIAMHDPVVKFCVSFITLNVAEVGLRRFTESWNLHPLEGRNGRMPNLVAANTNRVRRINNPTIIPSVDQAICMYENAGGSITRESSFGTDPLRDNAALTTRREELFVQNNSSFDDIFSSLVNGNSSHLERAILSFVDITRHLSITI